MALLAVAAGVSLAIGVLAAQTSAAGSVIEFNSDFAGAASLRVASASSHGGLPVDIADTILDVPGVGAAVPVIHTAVVATDAHGARYVVTALGVDCRVSALDDRIDCDPGGPDWIAGLDGPLLSQTLADALGPTGTIRTNHGLIPVDNALPVAALDELNDGQVVVFSLPKAQELFDRLGAVDSVFVVADGTRPPAALRADVQAAVGDWVWVADADAPFRGSDTFAPITAGLTIVGILGLGIGGQLIFNAVSLSLEERRRETATVGALGGRPAAVAAVVFAEAIALGVAGGTLGILGATVVERRLIDDLGRVVSNVSGVHLLHHASQTMMWLCVITGVGVAALAAVIPARHAVQLDLASELSTAGRRDDANQQLRPWRALIWMAVALVGVALCWLGGRNGSLQSWQVPAAYAGLFIALPFTARAAGLFGPIVIDGVRRVLGSRLDGRLAVVFARLTREPRRTAAMTLAVTAAVAMGIMLSSFQAGMRTAGANLAIADAGERVVVSTQRADNTVFVDSNPSPQLATAIAALPTVADVTIDHVIEADHRSGVDFSIVAGIPGSGYDIYEGTSLQDALAEGRVMIGPALARHLHAHPGDTITIPGHDGFHHVVVGGIWAMPSNQGYSMFMTTTMLEDIWGPQAIDQLYVTPEPGITLDQLASQLRDSDLDPDLQAWTPEELASAYATTWDDFLGPFTSLQQALVVMATVAVVSTMLLVGVQRRREDGVLCAVGLSPRGLASIALLEAAVITATGAVLGTITSLIWMAAMVPISALVTGLAIPYNLAVPSILTNGAVLAIVVVTASLIPAWRTSRIVVVEALQYE